MRQLQEYGAVDQPVTQVDAHGHCLDCEEPATYCRDCKHEYECGCGPCHCMGQDAD